MYLDPQIDWKLFCFFGWNWNTLRICPNNGSEVFFSLISFVYFSFFVCVFVQNESQIDTHTDAIALTTRSILIVCAFKKNCVSILTYYEHLEKQTLISYTCSFWAYFIEEKNENKYAFCAKAKKSIEETNKWFAGFWSGPVATLLYSVC